MDPDSQPEPSSWGTIDDGTTVGQKGSEGGLILRDEEHFAGARITLERLGSPAPFAITCGIYSLFVHTAFADDESSALQKYNAMKQRLDEIIALPDLDISDPLRVFADTF